MGDEAGGRRGETSRYTRRTLPRALPVWCAKALVRWVVWRCVCVCARAGARACIMCVCVRARARVWSNEKDAFQSVSVVCVINRVSLCSWFCQYLSLWTLLFLSRALRAHYNLYSFALHYERGSYNRKISVFQHLMPQPESSSISQ